MKFVIPLVALVALSQGRILSDTPAGTPRGRLLPTASGQQVVCFHCVDEPETEWYSSAVFYQIYPKSFKDSNNDGMGDLRGIADKIDHLKKLGVTGVWLSPVFKSPQKDGGYDTSNYYEIDPIFGTMKDMEHLILTTKRAGIKLVLDYVPNHTSDLHQWFIDSENNEPGYEEFYVWNQGKNCKEEPWEEEEGVPCEPPNNWISVFGGPAWEWSWKRNAFYLHQFTKEQPDLNYHNPRVREEMKNVLRFWMAKGIDGFRVDAINHAFEDPELRDEVLAPWGTDPTRWSDLFHNLTKDWPDSYELVYDWRDVLDEYSYLREIAPKVMMTEAYALNFENQFKWFGAGRRLGSHIAFNFVLIDDLNKDSTAEQFASFINGWIDAVPTGNVPNWVAGNHDQRRIASKWGVEKVEPLAFLLMTLPGIGIIYQGEEIGMVDHREITWEETQDPSACNTNDTAYKEISRDPVRTPFQWDSSAFAGFNDGSKKPWLPVHPDYENLNLADQIDDPKSVYNLYVALIKLRKLKVYSQGKAVIKPFFGSNVLGILRYLPGTDESYITVINLGNQRETVDLTRIEPERTGDLRRGVIILASSNFNTTETHPILRTTNFNLNGNEAFIVKLISDESA